MTAFLERYSAVFGGGQALLLRMAGLSEAEYRADGASVYDRTGRAWLDFGSFGLHLLGHRHPRIVEAALAQIGRMGLSTKILGSAEATECAEALCTSFTPRMDGVIFGNSGAEAVEAGLKVARIATGRRTIMALRGSYHGKTDAALQISDTLGHRYRAPSQDAVFVDVGDIDAARARLAQGDIAAIVIEPVQGEGGVTPVPEPFIAAIAESCRLHGTLLVLDEIQTGLGRCGAIWAADAIGCEPDIVLAAKTLGGGMIPVSAMIYRRKRIRSAALDPLLHASTFSGSPLACHVAHEVVRIVRDPTFIDRLQRLSQRVETGLRSALRDHPGVRDIRGRGLMWGVECISSELAGEIVIESARTGLLITFCLSKPSVLRFYPPAIATDDEIDRAVERLADAIEVATLRVFGDAVDIDRNIDNAKSVKKGAFDYAGG